MLTDIVPVTSPRWMEALTGIHHDFFHLPDYLRLASVHECGEPYAFVAQDADAIFFVPLVVRQLDSATSNGWRDATSAYGHASPLFHNANPGFAGRAVQAFVRGLREARIVSCFLRLHPLIDVEASALADAGHVIERGRTVSVDLTQDADSLRCQMRKSHRRSLKHAAECGYEVWEDVEWSMLDPFVELYQTTMRRRGARPYYLFTREFFDGLRRVENGRVHLFIVRKDGRTAAASLYTECRGIVSAFLGGTQEEYIADSPLLLADHAVCAWAKARGNHVFHLGGGVGGKEDSLFHFKAGFSPIRHPFRTWHIIGARDRYADLVRERGVDPASDYFPAYRRPSS